MDRICAQALEIKSQGYNCAQAVLGALAPLVSIDKKDAMIMMAAFGGGMRHQQLCGAVLAAGMAIGHKYGVPEADRQADKKLEAFILEFINEFSRRNGTTVCKELLDNELTAFTCDFEVESQSKDPENPYNIKAPICGRAITDAVDIAAEILRKGS